MFDNARLTGILLSYCKAELGDVDFKFMATDLTNR